MKADEIQIVIPMSGEGSRFRRAGYKNIKPLIEIDNRPIIDYVISLFPQSNDFLFLCRNEHLAQTNMRDVLKKLKPKGRIISVEGAKKGPVYAVSQAYEYIDDKRPVIVPYCDFYQTWNYADFIKYIDQTNCDGAIPCYKGFHPHLLHEDNFYASCRVTDDNKVLQIREKYSFTPNKQESPQSSGMYYFRTGALMKKYFSMLMQKGPALNGEYYASLVYTHMIDDGLDIRVYDKLDHFCQWGTPQDMEEYLYWEKIFKTQNQPAEHYVCDQKLIPMAGAGSRFAKEGYEIPKPLIQIDNKPMVVAATQSLPDAEGTLFICQEGHLKNGKLEKNITKHIPNSQFIAINGITQGQACTCLLAKDQLKRDKSLIIGACDNGMIYDKMAFSKATQTADCLLFTFRNNPTVVHKPEQYGWAKVKSDGQTIASMSVKKAISDNPLSDHAVVGAFWFKEAGIFIDAANRMIEQNRRINGEFYVDELVNDVVALGYKAEIFEIDSYICWGTPDDLRTYEYWQRFFCNA